jgi:hypothetical protein
MQNPLSSTILYAPRGCERQTGVPKWSVTALEEDETATLSQELDHIPECHGSCVIVMLGFGQANYFASRPLDCGSYDSNLFRRFVKTWNRSRRRRV